MQRQLSTLKCAPKLASSRFEAADIPLDLL